VLVYGQRFHVGSQSAIPCCRVANNVNNRAILLQEQCQGKLFFDGAVNRVRLAQLFVPADGEFHVLRRSF
jgi:hypothetical protein